MMNYLTLSIIAAGAFLGRAYPAGRRRLRLESRPSVMGVYERYQETIVKDWFEDALRCMDLSDEFFAWGNGNDIGGKPMSIEQISAFSIGVWPRIDALKTAEWKRIATIRFKTDLDELLFLARSMKSKE